MRTVQRRRRLVWGAPWQQRDPCAGLTHRDLRCPIVIGHYVRAHSYLPPRLFIDAVLVCHETWRNAPPAPWLPDDAQRLDFQADD